MAKDSVILVIPVYNEEQCIEKVISDWREQLLSLAIPFEIQIVNDGSNDKTGKILESLKNRLSHLTVIHQTNAGHGAAVKNGYIRACQKNYDYVFQTDSDDQFSSEDFIKVWERRHESQAVFGHRVNRHDPLTRKLISFSLRKSILDIFQVDIPDANIPYRLFKRDFLKNCLTVLGPGLFAPNIFLSILSFTHLGNCPVVPVQHFARQGDTQKLMSWGLAKACLSSMWQVVTYAYQLPKKLHYLKTLEDHSLNENVTPLKSKSEQSTHESIARVA